jgi:plasmid stabilization system protein ParE
LAELQKGAPEIEVLDMSRGKENKVKLAAKNLWQSFKDKVARKATQAARDEQLKKDIVRDLESKLADTRQVKPQHVLEAERQAQGTIQQLVDELKSLGEQPRAGNLDEYVRNTMAIQQWVDNYRQMRGQLVNHKRMIYKEMLRRTSSGQKELMKDLIKLGEGTGPLTLEAIDSLLIRIEPKFSSIGDMIKSGLLDPQMSLDPSTSTPSGSLADPSLSIDHSKST